MKNDRSDGPYVFTRSVVEVALCHGGNQVEESSVIDRVRSSSDAMHLALKFRVGLGFGLQSIAAETIKSQDVNRSGKTNLRARR